MPDTPEQIAERLSEARPDFDPDRCQWCGETGFDLEGLAEHVWHRCEVVERLAQANMENVRQWHQRNYDEAQQRAALTKGDSR